MKKDTFFLSFCWKYFLYSGLRILTKNRIKPPGTGTIYDVYRPYRYVVQYHLRDPRDRTMYRYRYVYDLVDRYVPVLVYLVTLGQYVGSLGCLYTGTPWWGYLVRFRKHFLISFILKGYLNWGEWVTSGRRGQVGRATSLHWPRCYSLLCI